MYEDPPDGRAGPAHGPARRGEREKKTARAKISVSLNRNLLSSLGPRWRVPWRSRPGTAGRVGDSHSATRPLGVGRARPTREVAPRAVGPDGTPGRQPSLGPAPRDRTGRRADAATRRSNA